MEFPKDTPDDLIRFYSKHALRPDGRPTTVWERENLVTIPSPYPLTLSFDPSKVVRKLTCHKKVAPSLTRVLEGILAHFGDQAGIERARMHLYGGCYNFRPVSGSSRLSTHAWGAGIDLDPDRNPMGKAHDPSAGMMPLEVVALFDAEGWRWGGRFRSRPDCMHFQATK